MPGASISRWTMSYFAASLAFLLVGQVLFLSGFGYPVLAIEAPQTLVVVHVIAIGWLGLLFCGALLQFVPVLVSRPLHAPGLAPHALLLLVSGVICLACGFVHMAGILDGGLVLLPLGGMLLSIGFTFIIYMIGGTLLMARPLRLPARFVGTGLTALAATAALGLGFTFNLSGVAEAPFLDRLLVDGLSLHAFLGLIGWMSITALGVSYRLLSMFLLAPEIERNTTVAAWLLLVTAVLEAIALALAEALDLSVPDGIYGVIMLSTIAAFLFTWDVMTLYRRRKRKALELNTQMSAMAAGGLAISACLFLCLAVTGRLADNIGALVYLLAFGWLSVLGLGQLYKIVAFLTWLECYGPYLGRQAVPRVQDLVNEKRAARCGYLYVVGVGIAVVALLLGNATVFRGAVLLQTVAVVVLVVELVRTRQLSYVARSCACREPAMKRSLFLPNTLERK